MKPQSSMDVSVNEFTAQLSPDSETNYEIQLFDLDVTDEQLIKITTNQLEDDISHWEKEPYLLSLTDKENIAYLMGNQKDSTVANPNNQTPYVDNRLFTSMRAMLAYATGQTAKPELLPSKPDEKYKHIARQTQLGLYQHALDHEVNQEMRLAFKNLIYRKRGFLKLRYDDDYGPFGDICTENIDPADIVVGRNSRYQQNPSRIWHKQKCSIQELCERYPDKKDQIYNYFGFKRGVYSQVSRVVTYWECWFSYHDAQGQDAEGVCWTLPHADFILGKMDNPNWIKKGSKKQQMIENICPYPIKPFICLNYWNTGRSFIDETCLFDQARPLQDVLNKRGRQIVENADYANPRLLANGALWGEGDAKKFVNKSPKTIGLLNNMAPDANINNAVMVIQPSQLPAYVMEDKLDARNEIDAMMGTPSAFSGIAPSGKGSLGEALNTKNRASALQDDLVGVIHRAWRQYYTYLLHMMNVYLPDDYFVMVQGEDGEYNHIMLSSDNIDSNVRVTIRVDSTLPLDKEEQRATAVQLMQMNKIDLLSAYEMLGLPEPEKIVERTIRQQIDMYTYMQSVEQRLISHEAEADIRLLIANKIPEERDDYNEDYLNHFNLFISRNEFRRLPQDAQARITNFLSLVANKASETESLRNSMVNPAGIIDRPPIFPLPTRHIDYRIMGQMAPQDTANMAENEAQLAIPVTQAQQAQNQAQGAPGPGQASPPAPVGQASQPRIANPSQFTTH